MRRIFFSFLLAALFLTVHRVEAKPIPARITVGSKTSSGVIVSRKDDLITFRITGMGGDISYPVDASKEVEFPVRVDESSVNTMLQNRMHEQLASTLEAALAPFAEYSDLPSNIARYQGVLMELYYKVGNYEKTMSYSAKLMKDDRDPELQRKAVVYQGLSLLGPAPANIYKMSGKYRWQLLVKYIEEGGLKARFRELMKKKVFKGRIKIDVDPQDML